jgi:hypothetical protein
MRLKIVFLLMLPILMISLACQLPFSLSRTVDDTDPAVPALADDPLPSATPGGTVADDKHSTSVSGITPERALSPDHLVYLGAFRLPDDSGGMGWDYSGHGMTHFPGGNPVGRADDLPGSLFMVGHDHRLQVAEISIPNPVISKNLEDLNTAETLQPFADITGGMISDDLQIPRMGIAYLPAQQGQTGDQIHFAIGQHFQVFEPSHGWVSLDLSNPVTAGLWLFDGFTNYATNDYLFDIPAAWADQYLNGYRLAAGRFREGVWSGFGPALFAYAPWQDGTPPAPGSTLRAITPLLLYGHQAEGMPDIVTDDTLRMDGYAESDHWWGGAWLTAEAGNAVIFTGTKALGESWYGFANGVVWDYACADDPGIDCPPVPEFPFDNRGYWAEIYQPAILFFDPEDLAKVAVGEAEPYEPQPYALIDLTAYWFDPEIRLERYKRDLVGAAAFDRENGLLYIVERLADADKSLIHVFRITNE